MTVPRLRQVVLDSLDARRAAEFWRQLLDLVYAPGQEEPDPAGDDWLNLRDRDGRPVLAIQRTDTLPPTTWPSEEVPQQLHLDLSVTDRAGLEDVHDRALALGASVRMDRSDDPQEPLRVYTDPDGHTFCVFVSGD